MKKLLSVFLISAFGMTQSLWTESEGVAIRQGVHIEWQRTVCETGDGESSIVFWSDTRNGNREVFAQKVYYDGNMVWGEDGKPVTQLPGRQEDPVAIGDGSGGAFVAWVDYRFDEAGDIFLQHIDSNGDILLDSNGVALCQQPGTQITINMCTDGNGGVYVTWQDGRNGVDDDIFGTHVGSDHSIVNEGIGYPVAATNGDQYRKSIEYGGNGEALLVWTDTQNSTNAEIYGQRFGTDMMPMFAEDGLNISDDANLDVGPRTTFMHGDTSLVTWQSGDEESTVIYNLVSGSGTVFTSHRPLSNDEAIKSGVRVKNDALGNVFVIWKDLRLDAVNGDPFAQKVDGNGNIAWDSSGVLLDTTSLVSQNVRFVSDGSGGAWFFWERGTFPHVDIVGSHIANNESVLDVTIVNISGYQFAPIATGLSGGGALIYYADQQSGSIHLRTQHATDGGNLFGENGLEVKAGLDGDVKFVYGTFLNDEILMAWEDTRSERKTYGSWVSSDGLIENFNGVQLTFEESESAELEAEPQMLLTDDAFYSLSYSTETGAKLVKLNKLNHALENTWDSSGVVVYEGSADQRRPILIETPDGNVGCFWSDIRNQVDFDIFYQVMDENGNPTLAADGVQVGAAQWVDDYAVAAFPTPDGNMFLLSLEDVWGSAKYIVKKFDYAGVPTNDWPSSGITVAGPFGDPDNLVAKIISDTDGILLSWTETNNFADDIKVQILHWDGTTAWFQGGTYATTADNDQTNISMDITDDLTTAMLVWEDFQNGNEYNITGQVIDLSNEELLGENVTFTDDTTYQVRPKIHSLDNDQFLIVWEDSRGIYNPDPTKAIGADLYWTTYSVSGESFMTNGTPLVQQFHRQEHCQFLELSDTELLIYWVDLRSSGKEDFSSLYGKLYMTPTFLSSLEEPVNPESYSLATAYPNPFNGSTVIRFTIQHLNPVEIRIVNMLGQTVYEATYQPHSNGVYEFTWNGTDTFQRPLSSGIYFYTIHANEEIQLGKLTYLK